MVLLGDPGSGKTTFGNYLAFCLAGAGLDDLGELAESEERGWLERLAPAWPHGARLPLPVTLRQFARSQHCDGTAAGLWDFIVETLTAQGLGDYAPHLRQHLLDGGVVAILDGLDEVSEPEQRQAVRDAVAGLASTYSREGNRYLVTCRGYAYQDPCCQLERFTAHALAPFNQEQIDGFIRGWYGEIERLGWKDITEAQELTGRLQAATRRADLAPLAASPLQLAMMASLHFSWGRLPDDRVDLYQEMVRLLLVRWQEARLGPEMGVSGLIGAGALESALEQVAFSAHRRQERPSGPADISQATMLAVLKDYLDGSWDRALKLVSYLQERAGLLIDNGNGTYSFPHRSYQEYLAGCYLAVQPDFPDQAVALVQENYAQWREVVLWAVGVMAAKKMIHVAVDVAAALCPDEQSGQLPSQIEWRRVRLAGESLLEIGLKELQTRERHGQVLARIRRWLVALLARQCAGPHRTG